MATQLKIGFKAFDPHELLCHFVALEAGLYRHHDITVELFDLTFAEDSGLPEDMCQVSCGAAMAAALKGSPQRVVFVAVDKPMFWIYARDEGPLERLAGKKMATYPPTAPPHHLANMVLSRHGMNAGQDLTLRAARDDASRLGLLLSGSVDAAVISSAVAPAKIERAGIRRLSLVGDEIRLPTTGLAVHAEWLRREPGQVRTLIAILAGGLSLVRRQDTLCAAVLEKYFAVEKEFSMATARYYRGCFTRDGRTSETIAANAVSAMGRSLGLERVPAWDEIYSFGGLS
jgi:ABC-type nitrate/sulfonate/bicarbonate transport system substrate-binding protein